MLVGYYCNKINLKNNTKIPTINNICPDSWIYIQEDDIVAGRLQIMNNWSPYLVKDFKNKVFISLEYFCNEDDEMWNLSDDEMINFGISELEKLNVLTRENVIDSVRVRVKKAYPAYFGVYKDFDFNIFFQGVGKRDVFIGSMTYFGFQGNKYFDNVHEHNMDYWTEDNQDAFFARPYATAEVDKNQQVQSRFIQNGAYLRLKNLQIGYTLPKHILQNVGIDRLRFYFSGENLLTFTKLMDGIDPETTGGNWGDGKSYPMSLVCSFGVNVSF